MGSHDDGTPNDDDLSVPSPILGRYSITARTGEWVSVLDLEPWRSCWNCGYVDNEPDTRFCMDCGAALYQREADGQLSASADHGLALVGQIDDEALRAALPPVRPSLSDGPWTLTLIAGELPQAPPLPVDELVALRIGVQLAGLLRGLHGHGYRLGPIAPASLSLRADGSVRLRDVAGLSHAPDSPVATDLTALADLIEQLTATPRTTRRLDDVPAVEDSGALPGLLGQIRMGAIADAAGLHQALDALRRARMPAAALVMHSAARSHRGMVRELNEDALLATQLTLVRRGRRRSWGLFVVADGMGGHSAGEVASDLAIRGAYAAVHQAYLSAAVDEDRDDDAHVLQQVVRQAIEQANQYVVREADGAGNDMGATMTMALVAGDRAVIGNIGDSRTYLWRDGQLQRISRDHSLVQRLVELGQITDEEAYAHPQRNAVLRSLGDHATITVDVFEQRMRPGDGLVLMSDGLWELVRDPAMAALIAGQPDVAAACDALVAAANDAGGHDNISVVFVTLAATTDEGAEP